MRLRDEGDFLDSLGDVKPATKRRLERQRAGGIWLSVAPSRFYSTVLSKKEFWDNIWLRYNYASLDIRNIVTGVERDSPWSTPCSASAEGCAMYNMTTLETSDMIWVARPCHLDVWDAKLLSQRCFTVDMGGRCCPKHQSPR
jgi:hypothetical protein